MLEEPTQKINIFLYALLAGCVVAICAAFYFFYFKKDYEFIVEVACDPRRETCFHRDCTNPDNCPPNQLSDFKRYSLNAVDFKRCDNENCSLACVDGRVDCSPIECVEDLEAGESCSSTALSSPVPVVE